MQLGIIGLGRMGANMARLGRAGHDCVVYDVSAPVVQALAREGATGTASLQAFVQALARPRTVWIMVRRRWWTRRSARSRPSSSATT